MPSDIRFANTRPLTGQTHGDQPHAAVDAARQALAEAETALATAAHSVATAHAALARADGGSVAPGAWAGAWAGGGLSMLRARRAAAEPTFEGGRAAGGLTARPSVWRYAAQRPGNGQGSS